MNSANHIYRITLQNHPFKTQPLRQPHSISDMMCKCSYLNEEELNNRKNRAVFPSSTSSSQVTTPKKTSSPSSSTSQREICTTLVSSPSSPGSGANTPKTLLSPRRTEALEGRSAAWVAKNEARNGGSTPRILLPRLKQGKLKRRVTIGSTLSTSSGSGDIEEADWPPFADEDYIVFCFEEDGAFHVVMEESPKIITRKQLQCEKHGNITCACNEENRDVNHLTLINRRDCLLPHQEADENLSNSELSPKMQQDGTNVGDHLFSNNKFMLENESTESLECRNGSIESTDCGRLDDEEQFHNEHNPEVELSLSRWNSIGEDENNDNDLPAFKRHWLLPNIEVGEEDVFLSPKSQLGMMIRIEELLKSDNDISSIESDQSSGFSGSDSRDDQDDQIEGNEEVAPESAKSSVSNQSISSSTSFKFPVLDWEWTGSPITWPRSGSFQFRKHKSRPACLRCCKF
ncbi:uncharacterized protein LOC104893933 isoform X3 [Beta vulgaris subsp. vulgaris]|uniref:uncharacterized protein LOC104893933 isoform X3 n=1 Tax=Beta vulgaris subsp. vulgaris TaxID=3555 RepID=UPI002037200D|nr:uncharacterized protein LOC104893933 isoform X3 [Beta vulgaris subsp. vulgaris]